MKTIPLEFLHSTVFIVLNLTWYSTIIENSLYRCHLFPVLLLNIFTPFGALITEFILGQCLPYWNIKYLTFNLQKMNKVKAELQNLQSACHMAKSTELLVSPEASKRTQSFLYYCSVCHFRKVTSSHY
jgi:hypothetical protein